MARDEELKIEIGDGNDDGERFSLHDQETKFYEENKVIHCLWPKDLDTIPRISLYLQSCNSSRLLNNIFSTMSPLVWVSLTTGCSSSWHAEISYTKRFWISSARWSSETVHSLPNYTELLTSPKIDDKIDWRIQGNHQNG